MASDLPAWHSQDHHVVRLEWGLSGAQALLRYAVASGAEVVAVVVDVLSFTTSVTVAADSGIAVHPYPWGDESAARFARGLGATLAVPRSVAGSAAQSRAADSAGTPAISLSPGSIRAGTGIRELVLPSPNGSSISHHLADGGASVVAGSLRNADAVAGWLVDRMVASRSRRPAVLVVPAGERWPDGSLRPAVEDLWGAGAVIAALVTRLEHQAGPLLLSPEATAALAARVALPADLEGALRATASGRELVEQGWADDVAIAAEVDASSSVPVMHAGAYRSA